MTTFDNIPKWAEHYAEIFRAHHQPPSFWNMDDIAYHLRASKSTVTRWVSLPDFPRPIRPPTAGRGLGHPLYLPAEVRKWAMGHREGATGRVGRPMKKTA